MQFVLIISIGFFMVVAAFVVVFISRWLLRPDELSPRLMTYVVEEENPTQRLSSTLTSRTRELSGSLASRVFYPFFRKIGTVISRMTPANSAEDLRHQLYIAGTPASLGPREYYGIRFALLLLGVGVGALWLRRDFNQINMLIAGLLVFMFMMLPVLWLRSKVNSQQNAIRKGFPDALDMLSVCADAGLGFDQSLQRVSEHWSTRIAGELGRVVAEMEMGLSRRDALRNLALRLDITEISSFVAVIIQSDQLGMSISDTLHAQAEQMRVERQYRAQEAARKIPTKMLIPLAFLIFPALMAIIMGPAVPSLVELFSNF